MRPSPARAETNSGLSVHLAGRKYQTLLAASLILLLAYPYLDDSARGQLLLDLMVGAVLVAAWFSVTQRRHLRTVGFALLIPALLGAFWPVTALHPVPHLIGLGFTALFFAFVTISIFIAVFSREEVTTDTLFGAVCVYVLLGLVWSNIYILAETIAPGSFNLDTANALTYRELMALFVYFSFTTLTTAGYGDVTPATDWVQSFAIIEQGMGVLYVAIMVARLVGMYRRQNKEVK